MGGRGSGSGISANGKPTVRISMQFFGNTFHELRLPKKEYGKIIREIDDKYNSNYKGKSYVLHRSGNYEYGLYVHGFNDYTIVSKRKIR